VRTIAVLFVLGTALLATGIGLVSVPATLMFLGVLFIALAYVLLIVRAGPDDQKGGNR
jgi:hypothetical protein